jgi:hypothetical protein
LFEGGELGIGHVAEPFRDRIGGKVQIQGLRRPAIAAVQKRRRGIVARRIRVAVIRQLNQCINCQAREPTGFYHYVVDGPTVCTSCIRSEFRRVFRPAARVPALTFDKTGFLAAFACWVIDPKPEYLRASTTRLGIGRRSAAVRSGAYTGGIERSFGRPRGLPDSPLTKRPFVVRFTLRLKPINPPSNLLRS